MTDLKAIRAELSAPWRALAACANSPGVPPDYFFPDNSDPAALHTRKARAICAGCIVKRSCLESALRMGSEGIWAATTMRQRRPYLRKLAKLTGRRHETELARAIGELMKVAKEAATVGPYAMTAPAGWIESRYRRRRHRERRALASTRRVSEAS